MSSNWAAYFREKGFAVVETERGFISAIIHNDVCLVDNFYVCPEYRGTSTALQLALQMIKIAEDRGCTQFAAEVYKSDPLYSQNVALFEHFGMSTVADTQYITTIAKRINHDRSKVFVA